MSSPNKHRLLFVNQHYWPDVASTGQHLTDLAEHLAGDGFEVSVLCATGTYLGERSAVPTKEQHSGVRIRRVKTTSFGRGTHIGRILDYASFYTHVVGRLLFGRHYDLVIVLTTPPLLGFACALGRKLRGQRYAIWSMDLHPDAEEALGMLKSGSIAARMLHVMNDVGYRNASLVVDLGVYMKRRLLEKGVAEERLHTIPVWSKKEEVHPVDPADNPLRTKLALEDRFVVMYSGNAGLAHQFEAVLETMQRLRNDPFVFFLFVGGGPQRKVIEACIEEHGITNASYRDYFPRSELAHSLGIGDLHLLTLQNEVAGIAVPGKLYGIMAAGRPLVMIGPGESEPADTIREFGIGSVIDTSVGNAHAADQLVATVLSSMRSPKERSEIGSRARTAFLDHFEQEACCREWYTVLCEQLGKRPDVPDPVTKVPEYA